MPRETTSVPPSPYEILQARNLNVETSSFANVSMDSSARPAGLNSTKVVVYSFDASGNVIGLASSTSTLSLGPTVWADLRTTNTGAQNIAALQAAHDILSAATTGGIVQMPAGAFNLAGTVTVTAGFNVTAVGNTNVIFRGHGMGGTRLTQQTAGVPTFNKTSGHAHSFENFYLFGPGTGNTESVGITWTNSAGGFNWKNLWIENFGVGARFIDCTSAVFDNVHFHANGTNVQLGYNCDIFNFVGGRCQSAITTCIEVGYRDAGHAAGSLLCGPTKIIGVRFGASPLAATISDYGASNIEFDSCYFENMTQIASIGDAAQAVGAKNVNFVNCFFTVVGAAATSTQVVANLNANQESTISFEHCRSDTASFAGRWVDLGLNGRLSILDSDLIATGAHVQWNGGTYTLDKKQDFIIDRGSLQLHDGSVQGSFVPLDIRMTNGTGKTWQAWTRRNAATGAVLGISDSKVIDINGSMVCMQAPILFATPTSSVPAASSTYRAITVYQQGGTGTSDALISCMKSSSGAYNWVTVISGS